MADAQNAGDGVALDDHDRAVMDRVNGIIAEANAKFPEKTIAQKLEWAWSENIRLREADSTDTVGRDADYYFAARHVVAADKSSFLKYAHTGVGEIAWGVYSALKLGTEAIGHPEIMRTDPDKPNAPVGGFLWMNRGALDGIKDRGEDASDVIPYQPSGLRDKPVAGKKPILIS